MTSSLSLGKKIGIVLLAAGQSARLGRPKQLLPLAGQTLLDHSLHAALNAGVTELVLVVGANAEDILAKVDSSKAQVIINENWEEGLSSSIKVGLRQLLTLHPDLHAVVLMTCDQPYVTSISINALIEAHLANEQPIVASNYGTAFGPPVLFHQTYFDELFQLTGDMGAKGLVKQHFDKVEFISFPKGIVDIDTEEDYQKYIQN